MSTATPVAPTMQNLAYRLSRTPGAPPLKVPADFISPLMARLFCQRILGVEQVIGVLVHHPILCNDQLLDGRFAPKWFVVARLGPHRFATRSWHFRDAVESLTAYNRIRVNQLHRSSVAYD